MFFLFFCGNILRLHSIQFSDILDNAVENYLRLYLAMLTCMQVSYRRSNLVSPPANDHALHVLRSFLRPFNGTVQLPAPCFVIFFLALGRLHNDLLAYDS